MGSIIKLFILIFLSQGLQAGECDFHLGSKISITRFVDLSKSAEMVEVYRAFAGSFTEDLAKSVGGKDALFIFHDLVESGRVQVKVIDGKMQDGPFVTLTGGKISSGEAFGQMIVTAIVESQKKHRIAGRYTNLEAARYLASGMPNPVWTRDLTFPVRPEVEVNDDGYDLDY